MPDVQPSEFVSEHAPWSISKINTAAQCSYLFHLKYVKKQKMEGIPASVEAMIGTAVHEMVELALRGHAVQQAYNVAIRTSALTTNELERVRAFIPALTIFLRRLALYRKKFRVAEPTLEQKWGIGFNGEPLNFWDKKGFFRGAVDLHALFTGRPYALIIDHKSGKTKPLTAYEWQFAGYSLLLRAHLPHIEKVQTGINHLQTESIDMSRSLSDVRDIGRLLNALMDYANKQTRTAYNHLQTKPSPLCGWCDYQTICPAHKHTGPANGSKA